MKELVEPKSKYVRVALQGLPWSQNEYIRDLLQIEEIALDPLPNGQSTSDYAWSRCQAILKSRYPVEFFAIHDELNPERANQIRARDKYFERARQEQEKREQRQMEQDRQQWLKLGGAL